MGAAWWRVLGERPEIVLATSCVAAALLFPTHVAGGAGLVVALALGGATLARWRADAREARWWHRLGGRRWLALAIVAGVLALTFHDQDRPRAWMLGDYGGQHAALAQLVRSLRDLHIPTWSMHISTGEAPFETYPVVTYLLAAGGAILAGAEDRLADALVITGIVAHAITVLGITRITYRIAPPWVAAVLGAWLVVDAGSISAGGVAGAIEWGLIHNAVAQAFTVLAMVAVMDALERPRLRTSVAIWVTTALATATHPAALLAAAAAIVALLLVGLLARDVPPRRAVMAAAHLALGAALAATVWVALGARLLDHGQHFSSALRSPARLLGDLLAWAHPPGTLAGVVYAGYVGLLAAVWSRRGQVVFVGAAGIVCLLAFVDTPFLLLDVAPSKEVARLGADRFYALARPFVFAGAGYTAVLVLGHVRAAWATATPGQRARAGAVLAIAGAMLWRAAVPLHQELRTEARDRSYRVAYHHGERELVAWARAQVAEMGPDRYARALFELQGAHYHFHLTAETGLPSFHMGPLPDLLLRERIEDLSPASLRRFNVRWVIERGRPPSMGDPATERVFGDYHVRELPGWDGQFARIERGAGAVRTVELTDERVVVELTGTDAPALVALGMGHYPRWRATDARGRALPVYALPTIPGGALHVPAAWLPPGRTVFTADGPLPSDGAGRGLAGLALLVACGGIVAWSRARWRVRVLRGVARLRARVRPRLPRARTVALLVAGPALLAAGLVGTRRPARGLELGVGLRGQAVVRARAPGQPWQVCPYSVTRGAYRCAGLVTVGDAIDTVLNDAQPLWPYTTPVLRLLADPGRTAEIDIRVRTRLHGRYWVGSTGHFVRVEVGAQPWFETQTQRTIDVTEPGPVTVKITGYAPSTGTSVAFVREDTLVPPRRYLVAPPATPPPALAAP